jgi:RNA-directed DNA polymerase
VVDLRQGAPSRSRLLKKAREVIREKIGPNKCYKPTPEVVKDLNTFLRGWSNYFDYGYPRKAFRNVCYYTR